MGSGHSVASSVAEFPECCAEMVMSRLNPEEICRLAVVNKAFWRASTADFLWESKLPANYEYLLRKMFDHQSVERLSNKKEIYSRLATPILFDAATKEIWLDRTSGMICMGISWKALKITGIHDSRYWYHLPTAQSRFNAIAYLQKVWWLEVEGEVEFNFPAGNYSLYFRLQVGKASKIFGHNNKNNNYNLLEQIHGWDIKPVSFQLSTSSNHGQQHCITQCYLKEVGRWAYYRVGDFFVEDHHKPMKLKFSMTQIDCTHSKGGLCFDSVLICPSSQSTSYVMN